MSEASYDAIASWYDDIVRTDKLINNLVVSSLLELIGDVSGQQACDLACGQGRIARELAQRGAEVVGIDLSAKLIEIAKGEESSNHIQYDVDNAETLKTITDERFDLVVCNLALMDIADLNKTIQTVWRVLRLDGDFVFSITHPCFEPPHAQWITNSDGKISREVSSYIDEGFWRSTYSEGVRGKVGAHHRMLSTYINTLANTGFKIIQIVEPLATTEIAEQAPRFQTIPVFMLIRCRKIASISSTLSSSSPASSIDSTN